MDLHKAHQMAMTAFQENGLTADGWQFEWSNGKTVFGVCRSSKKVIALSRTLTRLNDEDQVLDTILHEVAHAIAGHAAGHGYEWKRVARSLGCRAERTVQDAVTPEPKWIGTCPNGHTAKRHRLTTQARKVACGTCCRQLNRGRYTPQFLFHWTQA